MVRFTGSSSFTGGKIAAFNLSNDALFTDSFDVGASVQMMIYLGEIFFQC